MNSAGWVVVGVVVVVVVVVGASVVVAVVVVGTVVVVAVVVVAVVVVSVVGATVEVVDVVDSTVEVDADVVVSASGISTVVVSKTDLKMESQSKFPPVNLLTSQTAFDENSKSGMLVLFKISLTKNKSTLQLDERHSSLPK